MRLALLGDIHGNSNALHAVLAHLSSRSIDNIYHTGDIVGYCTEFVEVIETLITNSITGVVGNHEQMLLGEFSDDRSSPSAVAAIEWSKRKLTENDASFLRQLPMRLVENRIAIFHATPTSIVRVIKSVKNAEQAFKDINSWPDHWLAVHGHTHIQRAFCHSHGTTVKMATNTGKPLQLDSGNKYIICPGSVGISRDRDSRAAYAIFDTSGTLEFHRIPYDWRRTQRTNRLAGLSTALFQSQFGAMRNWIRRVSRQRINVFW